MTEQTIKRNNILPQEEVEAQAVFVARLREENDRYAEEITPVARRLF